ncbi:MAG: radical SAM protein [Dehalococcoidales bacterium]
MEKTKLPEPISGGLMLSYRCTAACRHCMYACSPKWKGWISEEDLKTILTLLAAKIRPSPYGDRMVSLNYGLHFTGGEPFLNFELLLKAVDMAQALKIPSTFVETNCYWCFNDKITREKLHMLKGKGLHGILISVNPFYLEYVPFERTERCISIAQEVFAENVMVYQLEHYFQFQKLGIKGTLSLEDYLKSGRDLARNVELFLMGRAAYSLQHLYPKYPPDYFWDEPCQPAFLRNWHNHFDNYGNYMPGYCGGISLAHWRNLNQILEEGINLTKYPILGFLINQDFRGLFRFAQDFGYSEAKEGYLSKCHLCVDMRKHLLTKQEFEELRPKEFYFYLEK